MEVEEKIITKRFWKTKTINNGGRLNNARSANRKHITAIELKDPIYKLQQIPLKVANERRQKIIKDKRAERIESNNVQQEWQGQADAAQQTSMIKLLTQAMSKFMEATNKEMENLKKMIELNYEKAVKDNKYMKTIEEKMDKQMENLIIEHKKMKNCWKAIRTFVENLVDELPCRKKTIEVNNENSK